MRHVPRFHRLLVLTAITVVDTCLAQQPTAQITGIITDASGAVIPDARIAAANINTGVQAVSQSNETGNYVFSNLLAGTYTLSVQKTGFSTVERREISLAVSQNARIDFSLAVGSTTETVEIHASPPLLEASSASVGQLIESKAVSDLPLNGRNFLQLAKLSSGVLEAKPGDRAIQGGSFIANGVRAQLNNFLLDGVDNNAKIVDQQNSSPVVIQPSIDAIQEFKVETNNYSAQYGYSAGAVVNANIKSGTNRFHGDVFEFLRNDSLDARSYFASPTARKPVLQQNQFGGVLGGPIVRNKAFFFGSYERSSINRGNTYVVSVPTMAQRNGDFAGQATIYDPATTVSLGSGVFTRTAFAGNRIPLTRFDPATQKLLAVVPTPTSRAGI